MKLRSYTILTTSTMTSDASLMSVKVMLAAVAVRSLVLPRACMDEKITSSIVTTISRLLVGAERLFFGLVPVWTVIYPLYFLSHFGNIRCPTLDTFPL